jgi:hypothetical protein
MFINLNNIYMTYTLSHWLCIWGVLMLCLPCLDPNLSTLDSLASELLVGR